MRQTNHQESKTWYIPVFITDLLLLSNLGIICLTRMRNEKWKQSASIYSQIHITIMRNSKLDAFCKLNERKTDYCLLLVGPPRKTKETK